MPAALRLGNMICSNTRSEEYRDALEGLREAADECAQAFIQLSTADFEESAVRCFRLRLRAFPIDLRAISEK